MAEHTPGDPRIEATHGPLPPQHGGQPGYERDETWRTDHITRDDNWDRDNNQPRGRD